MKRQRDVVRRREGCVALSLPAACQLRETVGIVAEFVVTNAAAEQQAALQQTEAFLCVARAIRDVHAVTRGHSGWNATLTRVQADVDLIVVKVPAGYHDR